MLTKNEPPKQKKRSPKKQNRKIKNPKPRSPKLQKRHSKTTNAIPLDRLCCSNNMGGFVIKDNVH